MAKLTKDYFGGMDAEEGTRINKYLSDAGICSRREADALIAAGKVFIDGVPAVMGSKVMPGQKVTAMGKEACREERLVLIAFNKPQGVVCTSDRREPDNIVDYINYGSRIFPIGRLDKDSEGLILLTNDGEIVNKILRAGNGHEKEYIVQVNKPLTAEFLRGMAGGVPILDTVTKPCLVEQLDKMMFRIVLTQGLNRQIRRMCEYFGYRVRALRRIRVMNINLGRLKTGTWRNLTEWELEELNELLGNSSNMPAAEIGAGAVDGNMPPEGIVILKKGTGKLGCNPKKEDAQSGIVPGGQQARKGMEHMREGKTPDGQQGRKGMERMHEGKAPGGQQARKGMERMRGGKTPGGQQARKGMERMRGGKTPGGQQARKGMERMHEGKAPGGQQARKGMERIQGGKTSEGLRARTSVDMGTVRNQTTAQPRGKKQEFPVQDMKSTHLKTKIKGAGITKKKEDARFRNRSGRQQESKDGVAWKKRRNV